MGICATAQEKFGLIEAALRSSDNLLSVNLLCELAGVSRSGYYYYLDTKDSKEQREYQDLIDFNIIKEAYNYRGFPKGYRRIHMTLLHFGIVMNPKKIFRLMQNMD